MIIEYDKNCYLETDNICTMCIKASGKVAQGFYLEVNNAAVIPTFLPVVPSIDTERAGDCNLIFVNAMSKTIIDLSMEGSEDYVNFQDFVTRAQVAYEEIVATLGDGESLEEALEE